MTVASKQTSKPHRRWLQFSLRALLIAVTLVGGLLVAWRVHVEPYRRQLETMALIKELGGSYKTEQGGPRWLRVPRLHQSHIQACEGIAGSITQMQYFMG